MSGAHGGLVSAAAKHRLPLMIAFCLTAAYMVAEIVGGLLTGSLALLSDAAHMGTDVLGLGMALAAVYLAQRPPDAWRTYGTYRLEVLASLANAVLLFGVAGYILFEAYRRFVEPPAVIGLPMLGVAVGGLIVNLISFRLLRAGSGESLNVKGAYLEVLSDLLGSFGVILAAIVIAITGWPYADPITAAGIGLFILPRTYKLGAEAVRILLEAAPSRYDGDEARRKILALDGVAEVHDLHVWTLTTGIEAASAHIVVEEGASSEQVLRSVKEVLSRDYDVAHSTIQCEPAGFAESSTHD